ncbi:ADP-ribosylation factor-like protein 2-binding protein [Clavelina lepadiformis]
MEATFVSRNSSSHRRFDVIIGTIEDIIMSEEFQIIQRSFMDKYYLQFEDTEENKFIYTDIFQEYGAIIERYLEEQLRLRIPEFSMSKFASSLQAHKDEITDEIFDMFITFTDFIAFKEMFLDYRAEKEGRNVDLMQGLVVHSIAPSHCSVVTTS